MEGVSMESQVMWKLFKVQLYVLQETVGEVLQPQVEEEEMEGREEGEWAPTR